MVAKDIWGVVYNAFQHNAAYVLYELSVVSRVTIALSQDSSAQCVASKYTF
jgi:hypothetical protein